MIRVFLRLEAAFPTDASAAPTKLTVQAVSAIAVLVVPFSTLLVSLAFHRGRRYGALCCTRDFSSFPETRRLPHLGLLRFAYATAAFAVAGRRPGGRT